MEPYVMRDASVWALLIQAGLVTITYPLVAIAYSLARAPQRVKAIQKDLAQLGFNNPEDINEMLNQGYKTKEYILPVLATSIAVFALYSLSHPFAISSGVWAGILEEVVDVFGLGTALPRDIVVGRLLFWAACGAWVYSYTILMRRFMAFDLSPMVYVFIQARFLLAFFLAYIVGIGLSTLSRSAGVSTEFNLMTTYIVAFFIGFFPERGIHWITATAKKALRQSEGIANERGLAELSGMSIWQQNRLNQEGMENAQNLASANIPKLVTMTPFTVGQIVDWVDQAILLVYSDANHKASDAEHSVYIRLKTLGIRSASDFIVICEDEAGVEQLGGASGIDVAKLKVLYRTLQSANNVQLVCYFRWQSSLDPKLRLAALDLRPTQVADKLTAPELQMIVPQRQTVEG